MGESRCWTIVMTVPLAPTGDQASANATRSDSVEGERAWREPVGIALVGMGWWGQKMLSVLEAAPADIRVVRAVEPNLDTVRALCAEKGVALSADYADALNDPAVEAVVLATPHSLHERRSKPLSRRASMSSAKSRWR